MVLCKFFMQGNCRYGNRCFNEHPTGGNAGKFNSYSSNNGGRQLKQTLPVWQCIMRTNLWENTQNNVISLLMQGILKQMDYYG